MAQKHKLSIYWAASCGGCEIAIVNIHEKILDVDAAFDLFFCPLLLDTKKKDIEDLPDGAIAVTLFNGAIRSEENREMARLMRRKSRLLIAFGACACEGGIPALANLSSREEILASVYPENPQLHNRSDPCDRPETANSANTAFTHLLERVVPLNGEIEVDYFIPGCPPESERIWSVLELVASGKPLPPAGSVIGAGRSSVCEECERKKDDKKIGKFYRTHEIVPDGGRCLLEQGIVCMGIATRDGCGALCPKVNMPCSGCYGPPEGVDDQGAAMIGALGSVIDLGNRAGLTEAELMGRIDAAIEGIPDCAGSFYRYSLGRSLLKGRAL